MEGKGKGKGRERKREREGNKRGLTNLQGKLLHNESGST
jgi:hypothetical protein